MHAAVGAGHDRCDVGRDRSRRRELPHSSVVDRSFVEFGEDLTGIAGSRGGGVRDDRPAGWSDDREGERRFEVGLFEHGEDTSGVGDLEL